jgi:hypothetical protein
MFNDVEAPQTNETNEGMNHCALGTLAVTGQNVAGRKKHWGGNLLISCMKYFLFGIIMANEIGAPSTC